MIKFGSIEYLYLLAIVPVFAFLFYFYLYKRKKQLAVIGNPKLMDVLTQDVSLNKRKIKFWFLMASYSFIILSLADPMTGSKLEEVKRRGIEIVVALDVSNSMMAEDVEPNRLDAAKRAIEKLADKFNNDRLALVIFAGEAYIQMPITSDMTSAKMFLKSMGPGSVAEQGTSLSKAIETSLRAFTSNPETGKVMILITDGEDHEGKAIEAAGLCKEKNVIIHVVGMGQPQGAPIPLYNKFGKKDFKTDGDGRIIVSKINEQMMQEIAVSGSGTYIRANNSLNMLSRLTEEIDKMNVKEEKTTVYSEYDHQYQYFLAVALILMIISLFFSERKSRTSIFYDIVKSKYIHRKSGLMLLALICFSASMHAQEDKKQIRQGNKYYFDKKYTDSEVQYRKAQKIAPKSFRAGFNLGDAIYKQEKYEEAEKQFTDILSNTESKEDAAKAYHNLGNTYLQQSKLDESIEAYKNALRNNPKDMDTKYNLSYALRKKQEQQKKQDQQQQKQDQQQQQQKQQQEQQKQDKNKDDQKKEQQKQDQKMSQEEAQRMLDAIQNRENETKDNLEKVNGGKNKNAKDW